MLNSISSCFRDIALLCVLGYGLTFQGHVTSSVTWPFDSPICGPLEPSLYSNGLRDIQCKCDSDAMVDMTLNDLQTKAKVIYFGTNRFLIYEKYMLSIIIFCSRTHRLATIRTQNCSMSATVSILSAKNNVAIYFNPGFNVSK